VNPQSPAKLEEIINKALEKDRDLRCQTAAELRADLKRLKRDTDSGRTAQASGRNAGAGLVPAPSPTSATSDVSSGAASRATGHPQEVPPRPWPLWLAASLAVTVAGVAMAWLLLHRHPPQPPPDLTRTRLTFNSSERPVGDCVPISSDGKYLALLRLSRDSRQADLDRRGARDPKACRSFPRRSWFLDSWFPDGTQLLADTEGAGAQHSMWMVSLLGQSAHELREGAGGWDVSPDGTRIAFSPLPASGGWRELWVVGSQGDNPQKVLALGENESLNYVHWSPDGRRILGFRASGGRSKVATLRERTGR